MTKHAFIYPSFDENNDFLISQAKTLEYCGYDITCKSLKDFRILDLVILNWYEYIYHSHKEIFQMVKRVMILFILKLWHVKIVFYVHDRMPHKMQSSKPNYFLSAILFKFCLCAATKVVILSKETPSFFSGFSNKYLSKNKKVFYIPHPNMMYLWNCKKSFLNKNPVSKRLKMLCFGSVLEYKGVDTLVKIMNDLKSYPIDLLIAGKCEKSYQERLFSMIESPNIKCDFRFFENDEIPQLFSQNDICVFPLDSFSALNSSSILLSFSMAKTVIAPKIATLLDYDSDCYYGYSYNTEEERFTKLKETILNAYSDKRNDSDTLYLKGKKCQENVVSKNNQELINEQFKMMLNI